jgi:endonuclease/exonuclease/phosphatase family metal-dependent hydrolase
MRILANGSVFQTILKPAATRLQYKLKSVISAVAGLGTGARLMLRRSCPFLALSAALAAPPTSTTSADALRTVLSGTYASSTPTFQSHASILNWNIDRGKNLDEIKDQIRQHKPKLCIFQEVDLGARRTHGEDVAKELAKTFGMNYVFAPEFRELGQGTAEDPAYHGQALLTTLPVRSSRMIRFEHQSGWWKPRKLLISSVPLLQRREGGRVALIAELDNGGKPLVVYNLHLESKGSEQLRLQQLEEVLDDAQRYPPETPVIVAGDFNTFVFHSRLIPKLREAGFRNVLGDRPVRTHVILGELDWVFVRGSIEYQDGQVLHVPGSDHFPITVDVRL